MDSESLPPCIVLGLETQIGLGIVRELGRAGIPVIGMTHDENAIGLRSRYLARGYVVQPPRSPAVLERIRAIGEEVGECFLLAVSEVNLGWLIRHESDVGSVKPILPHPAAFSIVLDKQRTLEAARRVGIAVPHTAEPDSFESVAALAASFPFPAVLKWKDPVAIQSRLSDLGLPLLKAEYVYGPEQLLAIGRRYLPVGAWPLVQEFCPGQGLGQFFFMHEGKALRRFQHLRIAEWPPEGGFSSVCDALSLRQHAQLQEQSIALLRDIGWEGMAMVEYRHDPQTGRSVLMEINGRFWGSFPLAVHCGAGFSVLAYFVQGLGRLPALAEPRDDLRCRMVSTELKRLWRLVCQPGRVQDRSFVIAPAREIARFLVDFLRPRTRYYLWSADDPAPFLQDLRNFLRKLYP